MVALFAVLLPAMVTTAQVATGIVRGRVIDESGTVVPDVRVAVDNRRTSADV